MIQDKAINLLKKNEILHVDMIYCIQHKNAELIHCDETGILLFDTASQAYMMTAESIEAARKMLSMVPSAELFVVHQPECVTLVRNKFGLNKIMHCFQSVYQKRMPISLPVRTGVAIKQLDVSYLSFVKAHHPLESLEYLKGRLAANTMWGVFVNNDLAGFIGRHPEGSMGMLEVLPGYQRNGLAYYLEGFLINHLLEERIQPFCQIVINNEASLALHKKLGCTISKETICWLMPARLEENCNDTVY